MSTRRKFLADVGTGMLTGAFGSALALDLGIKPAFAASTENRFTFGELEPLVSMMQETPLTQLQSVVVGKMKAGASLKSLVTAATLANARAFGGQDYIGYHTFMALAPALDMSARLPTPLQPLPVLKVLYRNTERIHDSGHSKQNDSLRPIDPAEAISGADGLALQAATRAGELERAERMLAGMAGQPRGEIYNHVQYSVHDSHNVHRVVLAWRAWLAVDLVGQQHAELLLRQSIRFCSDSSDYRIQRKQPEPEYWTTIPNLIDRMDLLATPFGKRRGDDEWVDRLAHTILTNEASVALDAVAQAITEGFERESISEAISLAANLKLLHDPGRPKASNYDKGKGSVHGDSIGVHASDAANAWRNIARVSNHRNAVMSLLMATQNTAGLSQQLQRNQWPLKHDDAQRIDDPAKVLGTLDESIRGKDQALAGAAVERYRELGGDADKVFDLLLRYATTEDGALHAEKYFRTVTEEFANTRASLRWRQLVALARVTTSEYGTKSPGYGEACDLLGVEV